MFDVLFLHRLLLLWRIGLLARKMLLASYVSRLNVFITQPAVRALLLQSDVPGQVALYEGLLQLLPFRRPTFFVGDFLSCHYGS